MELSGLITGRGEAEAELRCDYRTLEACCCSFPILPIQCRGGQLSDKHCSELFLVSTSYPSFSWIPACTCWVGPTVTMSSSPCCQERGRSQSEFLASLSAGIWMSIWGKRDGWSSCLTADPGWSPMVTSSIYSLGDSWVLVSAHRLFSIHTLNVTQLLLIFLKLLFYSE